MVHGSHYPDERFQNIRFSTIDDIINGLNETESGRVLFALVFGKIQFNYNRYIELVKLCEQRRSASKNYYDYGCRMMTLTSKNFGGAWENGCLRGELDRDNLMLRRGLQLDWFEFYVALSKIINESTNSRGQKIFDRQVPQAYNLDLYDTSDVNNGITYYNYCIPYNNMGFPIRSPEDFYDPSPWNAIIGAES